VPEEVGGYRLLRRLGGGGMGSVYEAEDVRSGRHVALKLVLPEYAESPETVERFRQEGRLASTISHPRCVFVLAADEDAGRPYIVMELMPGKTLEDLVREKGPLPPDEAISRILDVIDGLREAHRLGLVHRDVKPSNCFLERDSRVKVGDFGLARSLASDSRLTRTGTFLGTPLFAAPEQIKLEAVDAQADVYSVAATLYFLLCGRAPFESGDALATLARIVSDDPPPLRGVRPELSAALERVVMRGLQRERSRRWRDLDEFRAALLVFVPQRTALGGLGFRAVAYLVDSLVLKIVQVPLAFVLFRLVVGDDFSLVLDLRFLSGVSLLAGVVSVLYFTLGEGLWGSTLGKQVFRLRVWAKGSDVPGLPRALLRAGIFSALMHLQSLPALVGILLGWEVSLGSFAPASVVQANIMNVLKIGMILIVYLLLLSTARSRNGYRCLHDVLSGTRVVRLPEPEKRRFLAPGGELAIHPVESVPDRLGAYTVRGALRWGKDGGVLLAEDTSLGRRVLLWLRSLSEGPLSPARREVARAGRLRWLAGGTDGAWHWDAFLLPPAGPLKGLIAAAGPLPWSDVRVLLEQLTDELVAGNEDGTLPSELSLTRVWAQSNGHVVLLDMAPEVEADRVSQDVRGQEKMLALLDEVATAALEGRSRQPGDSAGPARAVVPLHARRLLEGLTGPNHVFQTVSQVQAELAATNERPTEVSRPRRAFHLLVQWCFLAFGLAFLPVGGCTSAMIQVVETNVNSTDQYAREEMEQGTWREFAIAALNPSPTTRLRGLVQLDADLRLLGKLEDHQRRKAARHEARLRGLSPPARVYFRTVGRVVKANQAQQRRPDWFTVFFRIAAEMNLRPPDDPSRGLLVFAAGWTAFWPALWTLWALLWRGGLSLRIAGLALVWADGQQAGRFRCAARALLVWLPVVGLLLAGVAADLWYWQLDEGRPLRWLLGLLWYAWWAGLALLFVYPLLALWHPSRGPHDRLAGTWVVPR
jgi:uncharacterized RDD family membrane protein YckC